MNKTAKILRPTENGWVEFYKDLDEMRAIAINAKLALQAAGLPEAIIKNYTRGNHAEQKVIGGWHMTFSRLHGFIQVATYSRGGALMNVAKLVAVLEKSDLEFTVNNNVISFVIPEYTDEKVGA